MYASLLVIAAAGALYAAGPVLRSYLSIARQVRVAEPERQNYLVVDAEVWEHARADLADLRLYDAAGAEVSYALTREGRETSRAKLDANVFNLARGPRGTEFLLDVPPGANGRQYDRVTLDLSATDFIGRAQVEGADDVSSPEWAKIGTYSIFDLSREKLGRNFELHLPTQRYRFLRIVLLAPVQPEQVKGASVADFQVREAAWTGVGSAPKIALNQMRATADEGGLPRLQRVKDERYTVITWRQPEHAPLDRIVVSVGGSENFRREFELHKTSPGTYEIPASGEISRVHLRQAGQAIDSENLTIDLNGLHGSDFALLVYNGDDRPLAITGVQPQSIQRRVYFDPRGRSGIRLYYGDEQASAPVYDYAKVFQRDPSAAGAELGPEERNAAYSGRPDERPWTERHPWVIWTALIVAVVVLGAVALRGLKS